MQFEVVSRRLAADDSQRSTGGTELLRAVLATLDSGTSVFVPGNGDAKQRDYLRGLLKLRLPSHLILRSRLTPQHDGVDLYLEQRGACEQSTNRNGKHQAR